MLIFRHTNTNSNTHPVHPSMETHSLTHSLAYSLPRQYHPLAHLHPAPMTTDRWIDGSSCCGKCLFRPSIFAWLYTHYTRTRFVSCTTLHFLLFLQQTYKKDVSLPLIRYIHIQFLSVLAKYSSTSSSASQPKPNHSV